MEKLLFIAFIFLFVKVEAQNIVISFSSSNPNDKIDSVFVENLYQNKSRVIKGTDNLELTASSVGVPTYGFDPQFKIYPNPTTDNCYLQFDNKISGNVELSLYDFTGRQLAQKTISLEQGIHTFQVSGLPAGISLLKVSGKNLNQTGKIVNAGKGTNNLNMALTLVNSNPATTNALKSVTSNVLMQYNAGETLKYTIYSSAGITVQTDVPTQSKTIETNFTEAKDGNGNRYATVKIGNQNWFAENLKTTKYNDGTDIPLVTDGAIWNNLTTPGYCWYNNDVANGNKYGALYNWYTVNTGKLCPAGWRVPSAKDWIEMSSYLISNGYNFINNDLTENRNRIAKSLSASYSWETTNLDGLPGSPDNMQKQNISGFSALAAGHRYESGTETYNFYNMGKIGVWWSNNSEIGFELAYNKTMLIGGPDDNQSGFSIRCVEGINYTDIKNDTIKDIDNNIYKTVVIGSQTWFAENLKTTKLNDSTKITLLTKNEQWSRFLNPGYGWYDNDSIANSNIYGALYNKYAVLSGKLCPEGWHIPNDKDWDVLEIHLADNKNYYNINGKLGAIAKALASPSSWLYSNIEGAPGNTDFPEIQNSTGFSALAGGRLFATEFEDIGKRGFWWFIENSNAEHCISIDYDYNGVDGPFCNCGLGLSVRCIKD